MVGISEIILVPKLEAAKRQLRTAIRLWFEGGDEVSIHTLACAAHEIIHVVSRKRNRSEPLIFDTAIIKDEFRSPFNILMKKSANFFKHANKDADDTLEFNPSLSVMFIMAAIAGLKTINEEHSSEELAFFFWLCLHRPDWVRPAFKEMLQNRISVEGIVQIRNLEKADFIKAFDVVHS
jgi:hypothetical protein